MMIVSRYCKLLLLLLMLKMLIVLFLYFLEIVQDLSNRLLIGGNSLIQEQKGIRNNLKLANNLLEVLCKLFILAKTSTSILLITIGICLGRNNNTL
jgi:hypothetical protein